MAQVGSDLRLSDEAASRPHGGQLRTHHRDGYGAAERRVVCEEDHAHATARDLAFDGVFGGQSLTHTLQQGRHKDLSAGLGLPTVTLKNIPMPGRPHRANENAGTYVDFRVRR